MAKKGAPTPPDPIKTAQAQTKSNIDTAVAQTNLNQVDTVGPGGSLTYTRIGTNPDGTPKYQATQAYSGATKTAYDNAGAAIAQPLDLSNDAVEARLMELGMKRLQPQLDQRRSSVETDLINRGIRPGSDNYDRAKASLMQGENDAFDQLALTGRQQAISEALTARNQPISEFQALNGSNTPISTPQTGVAGTDYASLINNDYATRAGIYNQQQSDLYGGLFGLGKAAIGLFSDKRLKTDIRPTGKSVAGVPVKSWRWKGSGRPDIGVIAQDAEAKHPSVVSRDPASGMRKVNYGKLMQMGAR